MQELCCHCKPSTTHGTGVKLAAGTVRGLLRKHGLQHLRPKVVPLLSSTQKHKRISFAIKALMGLTWCQVTKLKFVTGTHKLVIKHTTPPTGLLYSVAGSQKYTDVLQQHFVPEGNKFKLANRQTTGLCSKIVHQPTRPRKTWHALLLKCPPGTFWNGPPALQICHP